MCEPSHPDLNYFTTFAPIVGWFLIVVGWIAVHWTSVVRARRQEERETVKDLCARVVEIRDKALVIAHQEPAERKRSMRALRYDCHSLASRIEFLRDHRREQRTLKTARKEFSYYAVRAELRALRQAVTGNGFDPPKGEAEFSPEEVIDTVWYAGDALVMALHREFERANQGIFFL